MGNVIDVDIHIHLDKFHPPDPTGTTDYVALALVIVYALLALCGNVALVRISSRWKPIRAVNIPLVFAMSAFSLCHMICVYLDMYFWPDVTEELQRVSCVATAFWGEYFVGLGGFLAVLWVRGFSLLMATYKTLRPSGPKYRRTMLKCVVFSLFLMPIYSICLLISVDDDSQFSPELHGCDTPTIYKVVLVGVLVFYILLLMGEGLILSMSEITGNQAPSVLSIIWMSLPLLLAACVVHFAYMLPHYWGRLAFMCIVFALHTFAYVRITTPSFRDYRSYKQTNRLHAELKLDAFDEEFDESENAVMSFGDAPGVTKISGEVVWLMKNVNASCPMMTPEILKRIDKLRGKFFNHCKVAMADHFFTYNSENKLVVLGAFELDGVVCIPVYRLITFYNEIHNIYRITQTTYSTNLMLNAYAIHKVIKPLLEAMTKNYLSVDVNNPATMPINLPPRLAARIRNGFVREKYEQWDIPVLDEIMTGVLNALIMQDDNDYRHQFTADVEDLLEEHGQTLYALDEENVVALEEFTTNETLVTHIANLVKMLRNGRAVEAGSPDDDEPPRNHDILENGSDDDIEGVLQAAPVDETPRDEYLPGGAIIYYTPSRALFFFFVDIGLCIAGLFRERCKCCGGERSVDAHLDNPVEETLVAHVPPDTA